MGKADVYNQENMSPGDPALTFLAIAAAAHERAYPAAALIQSLATSAGGGGDSFAAPKPRAATAAHAACAPSTTPARTARALAPLSASSLNLSVGGAAGATTPTKQQQAAHGVGGEPLTPTCNLKVLVDVSTTAATTREQQLPAESGGGFATPKKAPCSGVEPLTPTANLKVLVSVASTQQRESPVPQEQQLSPPPFAPAKSQQKQQQQQGAQGRAEVGSDDDDGAFEIDDCAGREYSDDDDVPDEEPVKKKSKKEYVSRKDKSLGLLCQKFISRFDEYPPHNAHIDVSLDELAKDLGVERRRIYDIVNVLESVDMMSRRAKNRYLWHGKTRLVDTLTRLKHLAETEGIQQQLNIVREYELSRMSAEEPASADSERSSSVSLKQYMERFGNQMKKEKSLGIMSQKFLMLFLTATKTINLDIAAKILIGDPTMDSSANNAKFKTKIRRLYDIANILTSLHLIRKVHVTEVRGRKPAFQYVGPSIELAGTASAATAVAAVSAGAAASLACGSKLPPAVAASCDAHHGAQSRRSEHDVPSSAAKRSLMRHSSFDTICQVAESERIRLIASEPSSPLAAVEDESGGGQKPRQYVMIQGGGPRMQVITTSQAPNFLTSNVPPPLPAMPSQAIQRLTLIPVSSSALSTSAGHVVLRAATVNDMAPMCHFSPVHGGIAPLTAVPSSASLIAPYMNERHRSETFLLDSGKHLDDARRLLPEFGSPLTTSTLVLHGGPATSSADGGNKRQDDDFQVFRPVRMTTGSIGKGKSNAGPPPAPAAGQISCQQQLTPMNRGTAKGRGMSSLLNPARNIGKNIDLTATESLAETNLRTAASDYTLAAPSISEVPLTTISPVRPVASFSSPIGGGGSGSGGGGSLKTPVGASDGGSLKTPVNERPPPARSVLYTTPGFMPFASPSAAIPTAFRPVLNKTPGGSSHLHPETVRRLKLK